MKITLNKSQALVVFDLLRKSITAGELSTGEIKSSVDTTSVEWTDDAVEITLPD